MKNGGDLIRLQIKTSPYFHWDNYTLNKTFSLEREAQTRGGNLSQKLGEPGPKTGGLEVAPDFDSRFGGKLGDRSH